MNPVTRIEVMPAPNIKEALPLVAISSHIPPPQLRCLIGTNGSWAKWDPRSSGHFRSASGEGGSRQRGPDTPGHIWFFPQHGRTLFISNAIGCTDPSDQMTWSAEYQPFSAQDHGPFSISSPSLRTQ